MQSKQNGRGVFLSLVLAMSGLAVFGLAVTPAQVSAQSDVETGLDVFPNLSLGNLGSETKDPVTFTSRFKRIDDQSGEVSVTAKLAPNWYIYSVTQPPGGPLRTTLKLDDKSGAKVIGEFTPDEAPKKSSHAAWPGLVIEEHFEEIIWTAKVELPQSFSGPLEISVNGQVCSKTDGSCLPISEKLVATVSPATPAVKAAEPAAMQTASASQTAASERPVATPFQEEGYVVQWTGRLEPAVVKLGQRAQMIFTAKPESGYHVYSAAVDDTESSTNFVVSEKSGLLLGNPVPSSAPVTVTIHPAVPPIVYHAGEVSWSLPILVPEDAASGEKKIAGAIAYQACEDDRCLQPKALAFTTTLTIAGDQDANVPSSPVAFVSASFPETMDMAAETKWVDEAANTATAPDAAPQVAPVPPFAPPTNSDGDRPANMPLSGTDAPSDAPPQQDGSAPTNADSVPPVVAEGPNDSQPLKSSNLPLPLVLLMALAGGLILNFMPCVLPVVGLKVMAFAEQAGEHRGRVLLLNLWYTLGILVVFWALAALALTFSLSWGQQYTFFEFRLAIILLVFAMALSFLGVWEIPIPGFVGSRTTQELQRKEGPSGAFFKGVFTTILATPCSGPLLGPVFGFLLVQPPIVTVLAFTAIGLGMAMPFLLVALFPNLLAYFPKPGAWMNTFKELLGFLLLGTVVYLFSIFSDEDRIPVFASLIGVWFGCWLIGLVPGWASLGRRVSSWAAGLGTAAIICFLAFRFLLPGPTVLAWEPYDEARLQQLQAEGRTVLIDFTASWCPNCHVNYAVAINTPETSKLVDELNAIPMLADWSDNNEMIKKKLNELESNSIPVLAIYPGRNPKSPIILRDLVTQGEVLEALRKAGSSIETSGFARMSGQPVNAMTPTH